MESLYGLENYINSRNPVEAFPNSDITFPNLYRLVIRFGIDKSQKDWVLRLISCVSNLQQLSLRLYYNFINISHPSFSL